MLEPVQWTTGRSYHVPVPVRCAGDHAEAAHDPGRYSTGDRWRPGDRNPAIQNMQKTSKNTTKPINSVQFLFFFYPLKFTGWGQ